MSEPSKRPSVLMVAGASFTAAIIGRFTSTLKAAASYRVSALALSEPVGRTYGSDPQTLFERYDVVPALPKVGRIPFKTAAAALAAIRRPPGRLEKTYKARIVETLRLRQMRKLLPGLLAGYDLYHWHAFVPYDLPVLDLFPPDARIIVSLWGSDLYRTWGLDDYTRQLKACSRATRITVGSLEMRETFLAKFGRHWSDRIRLVNYGADNLDIIDQVRCSRESFLRSMGLDPGRIVVVIGNAGTPSNQHIAVLKRLENLSPAILGRIALLLPMTYNAVESYKLEVEAALRRLPAPARIIDQYMAEPEVARMWVSCDIFIHVPVSDQFSAAMSEALYAGAVLITGAWLPYSRLRTNRIYHHAVDDVNKIEDTLSSVVDNFPAERARSAQTAPLLRKMMAWDSVMPGWVALYDEVLGNSGRR